MVDTFAKVYKIESWARDIRLGDSTKYGIGELCSWMKRFDTTYVISNSKDNTPLGAAENLKGLAKKLAEIIPQDCNEHIVFSTPNDSPEFRIRGCGGGSVSCVESYLTLSIRERKRLIKYLLRLWRV